MNLHAVRPLSVVTVLVLLVLSVDVGVAAPPSSKGYVVGSAAPLSAHEVDRLQAAGARVKYVYQNFGGAAAVISDKDVAKVRALSFVTSVSLDSLKQLHRVPTRSTLSALPGQPYWLDLIDAEKNTTYRGNGVWVAVLDTGFYQNWRDYLNPDSVREEYGMAFVGANGNPNENQWDVGSDPHGMAVAATIVGSRFVDDLNEGGWGEGFATGRAGTYAIPGVAPGAQIIPVKVCEPTGCWGSAIDAGMDYVTSLKKANPSRPIVINESLGGSRLDAVEKAALDAAIAAGVIVVASAGNAGAGGMTYPAAYEPVISVGAGGWTQQWESLPAKTWWLNDVPEHEVNQIYIAGFSSRQKAGQYLDVVSTGRYLLLPYPCANLYHDGQETPSFNSRTCASKATPDNTHAAPFQFLFISGTSFAAPTITGIVALMLEKNGSLSNADATFGTLDDSNSWGPGLLERSLEMSASATPIPPGSVEVMHRTGETITEKWGTDATGYGWVLVEEALKVVPSPP